MSAVFFAPASAAQSPAVSDFKTICMATYADPATALAAADTAGWAKDEARAKDYKSLGGGSDGRVIAPATTNFRILSVGETSSAYETNSVKGVRTIHKCVLLAVGTFDLNSSDIKNLVPLKVGKKTNEHLQWRYAVVGDQYLSLDHGSVEDAVKAGQAEKGSLLLTILQIDGGIIFSLSADHAEATRKTG